MPSNSFIPSVPATRSFLHQLRFASLTTAAIASVLWCVFRWLDSSIWPAAARPEQCEGLHPALLPGATPVYSPEALARVIREPENSWSCLAYFLVAVLIVQRTREVLLHWFAVTVAVLGAGAFLYHASGTRELRHFDVAALYWVYGMVLVVSARRVFADCWCHPLRATRGHWFGVATFVAATAMTIFRNVRVSGFKPLHVSVMTGVMAGVGGVLLFLICLRRRDGSLWWLWAATLTLLGVGIALQIGDRPGNCLCRSGAPLQAHALWHFAGAACLGLTAEIFVRSANKPGFRSTAFEMGRGSSMERK